MTSNVINKSSISLEVKEFLKLSVPLACAQIAQAAVGFVDTIMMGHLSIESLAAGGLAATTFQLILNTFSGLVMAVSPLGVVPSYAQFFSQDRCNIYSEMLLETQSSISSF